MGCPALHLFKALYAAFPVWVPDSRGILQYGPYHGFVGGILDLCVTLTQVPTEKTDSAISLAGDVVNVIIPSQRVVDRDPKVFAGISSVEELPM